MTTSKKALLSFAGALAMLGASAAYADPVTFITEPNFEIKFVDFEFAKAPADGVNIGGIFSVSTINPDGGVPAFWTAGSTDGTLLNGYFSNITINSGTSNNFTATGGLLVLYNVPLADGFNPGTFDTAGIDPTNQLCGGSACPDPYLTALFVPGIGWTPIAGFDNTTTVSGSITQSNPINGNGGGYLSLADVGGTTVINGNGGSNFALPGTFVGTHNSFFDSNGFTFTGVGAPDPADLLFGSRFFQCGNFTGTTPPSSCTSNNVNNPNTAVSDDPVRGALAVPEPGTLALLGLSMAGLAVLNRRRKV
jgi:hypothetical protein